VNVDDQRTLELATSRRSSNCVEIGDLARRAGLELRDSSERLDLAQPARQWVPAGEDLRPLFTWLGRLKA
jgi:hypothetical protein